MKTQDKILNTEVHFGQQNSEYRQTLARTVAGKKVVLKLIIHTDSYVEQAYARAEIFSATTNAWNKIASILPQSMRTDQNIGYSSRASDKTESAFILDRSTLLKLATETLELANEAANGADSINASVLSALSEAQTAVDYYHEHEGAPDLVAQVKAALKAASK